MKELVVFNGTLHKIDAVRHIHQLPDRNVVLLSVQSGVFPITPLAYFAVDKTLLTSLADSLGYAVIPNETEEVAHIEESIIEEPITQEPTNDIQQEHDVREQPVVRASEDKVQPAKRLRASKIFGGIGADNKSNQ